jgi:hypothetical protein
VAFTAKLASALPGTPDTLTMLKAAGTLTFFGGSVYVTVSPTIRSG